MDERLEQFIKTVNLPGELIFARIWGSIAHNTATEKSDCDFVAIYKLPLRKLLSVHTPDDTVTNAQDKKPDFQAHELKKFCNLLLKGNPGIIECLFSEKLYWGSEAWEEIRRHKKAFISQVVVKQYLGYAQGQLHKIKSGKSVHTKGGVPGEKWAYHLIRLIGDADKISRGEYPVIWKEGEEREKLMKIRNGETPLTEIVPEAEAMIAEIDSRKPWPIPERANEEILETWLLKNRGI